MYRVLCRVCLKEFRDKWTLKRHLREVHERFQRRGSLKRAAEPEVREPELRKKPGTNSKLKAKETWHEKISCEKTRLNAQLRQLRIHSLVGSVDESDDMHLARHAGPAGQNCLRCVVIRNKERLARIAPWASERPSHLGGPWGLGLSLIHI